MVLVFFVAKKDTSSHEVARILENNSTVIRQDMDRSESEEKKKGSEYVRRESRQAFG